MAITSVDVDRAVIDEIKAITTIRTDKEVINKALEQHLALLRQQELLTRMGTRTFTEKQLNDTTLEYPL